MVATASAVHYLQVALPYVASRAAVLVAAVDLRICVEQAELLAS